MSVLQGPMALGCLASFTYPHLQAFFLAPSTLATLQVHTPVSQSPRPHLPCWVTQVTVAHSGL